MSWLVLEADGSLAAILTADPGALEERRVVEAEVPENYPELADWDAATETFVPSAQKALARLRGDRDARLRECDWTQLPDVAEEVSLAWQPYRQALRDMPESDPFAPEWPAPPE